MEGKRAGQRRGAPGDHDEGDLEHIHDITAKDLSCGYAGKEIKGCTGVLVRDDWLAAGKSSCN